jgi:hypothetical protein
MRCCRAARAQPRLPQTVHGLSGGPAGASSKGAPLGPITAKGSWQHSVAYSADAGRGHRQEPLQLLGRPPAAGARPKEGGAAAGPSPAPTGAWPPRPAIARVQRDVGGGSSRLLVGLRLAGGGGKNGRMSPAGGFLGGGPSRVAGSGRGADRVRRSVGPAPPQPAAARVRHPGWRGHGRASAAIMVARAALLPRRACHPSRVPRGLLLSLRSPRVRHAWPARGRGRRLWSRACLGTAGARLRAPPRPSPPLRGHRGLPGAPAPQSAHAPRVAAGGAAGRPPRASFYQVPAASVLCRQA